MPLGRFRRVPERRQKLGDASVRFGSSILDEVQGAGDRRLVSGHHIPCVLG
jgi:hypothetical protein